LNKWSASAVTLPRTAPLTPGRKVARILRTCALAAFYSMLVDYAALSLLCRAPARVVWHDPRALALRPAGA
jgi:hypothetical protein